MNKKLTSAALLFISVIAALSLFLYTDCKIHQKNGEDLHSEEMIALNEIDHLAGSGNYDEMHQKTEELREYIQNDGTKPHSSEKSNYLLIAAVSILMIISSFAYIHFKILLPFRRLKSFAGNIAQGNFDIPLDYERSNYFGDFTWAFDCMRREITKSRATEKEAVENNKTVIATLSHDIKTPIASIRAYAEGLEANLDSTPEKRSKYLSVIMRKCDEVSKLTNDLFLHSVSDLEKLHSEPELIEICDLVKTTAEEISGERDDVRIIGTPSEAYVMADRNRIVQIVENLINNARKYAEPPINILITRSDGFVTIVFRDHGKGIPDDDVPFIFDKFYRGKNCGSEQGSELGLYIVKYIAGQHLGSVSLHNLADGLEVSMKLPEASV